MHIKKLHSSETSAGPPYLLEQAVLEHGRIVNISHRKNLTIIGFKFPLRLWLIHDNSSVHFYTLPVELLILT
jgi:hypothetical protein